MEIRAEGQSGEIHRDFDMVDSIESVWGWVWGIGREIGVVEAAEVAGIAETYNCYNHIHAEIQVVFVGIVAVAAFGMGW